MPTTTKIQNFNIHRLTNAQYNELVQSNSVNPNELYLISDSEFSVERTNTAVSNTVFTVVDAVSTNASGIVTGINVKTVTIPKTTFAGSAVFMSGPSKYTEIDLSGSGLTITSPDQYAVIITPTSELGKVGEIMVNKTASSFKVYHTGASTGTFDYIVCMK